jgi:hypothetical protein
MNSFKIKIALLFLLGVNAKILTAQFIYEKKFKDGTFSVRFDKYTGPMIVTLKLTNSDRIDTIYNTGERRISLYVYSVSDAYLSGDTLLFTTCNYHKVRPTGGFVNVFIRTNNRWESNKNGFRGRIFKSDDLYKNHKAQFIDSRRVKTIVDGVEKMYEMDYKDMIIKEIIE